MEGQTQAEVERAKLAKARLFGGEGSDQLRKQMIKARFLQSLSPPAPTTAPKPELKTGGDETRDQREGATEPSAQGLCVDAVRIGRFRVLRKLGEGGMGVVYAAYDEQLDRQVALKLLHQDVSKDERGRARMQREAQALARLSHPNVVQVHEIGQWQDHDYVAMEFVGGLTLQRWVEDAERSWRQVLDVMILAGRGLAAAHAAGLVHRDFKPANVLVGSDGRPRVLDFGLARAAVGPRSWSSGVSHDPSGAEAGADVELAELFETGEQAESRSNHDSDTGSNSAFDQLLTATGAVLGTPAYMAPEQHLGDRATELSDQFSFCLVMYEALFGERPYKARSRQEYSVRVRDGDFIVPGSSSGVPGWLRQAVCRGLAPQPADRWASMDALLAELGRDRGRIWRRATVAAGLLASVGVALVLGGGAPSGPVCKHDRSVVAESWGEPQRASMRAAFAATELDGAAQVFERTARDLDTFADELVAAHDDACAQRWVEQTQTDQQLELRMACLEQREVELGAVVELFAAADQGVVLHASELIAGLGDIEMCAAVDLLERHTPTPKDAVTAAAIAQVRKDIATAKASAVAGKMQVANELTASIELRAADLDYGPLLAEVRYSRGSMHLAKGELPAARLAFIEAAYLAELGNYDELRWRTSIMLAQLSEHQDPDSSLEFALARAAVSSLGDRPIDHCGLRWAQARVFEAHGQLGDALAEFDEVVALARAGFLGSEHTLVWALKARASVAAALGRDEQARADLVSALQLRDQLGADDVGILQATLDLAILELGQHDYAAAERHFTQARAGYARVHGPEFANVGHATLGLAEVALARDQLDDAEQLVAEALKIFTVDHLDHAWALDASASIALRQGAFVPAVDALERALSHSMAVTPDNEQELGYRHGRLGHALARLGQHERALTEFELAIELLDGDPAPVDQVTPLIDLGTLRLELGQPELAQAAFERAMAVTAAADGRPTLAAEARIGLAEVAGQLGDDARRLELATEAERLVRDLPGGESLRQRAKELQGT
ncbi:serine/threonine-protein kinase [Enhygromyxa salina]|uniref:Serine/threonine-protein kinase StkP n=1 Tax=Enhygromyxa salina TaxID=215803 RepID=A0A2S9YRR8_9BACT|nr:serine/threonine-protein kinase [Enhygromyxa salina]PRQ07791.1 Serine/threonine-protein kinase StkP [Enhygromyxa salina]